MTEITNAAELDALPVGTVVLDRHGDVWQKHDDTERTDDDGERLRSAWASTAWVTDRTPAEMFGGLRGARDYTQVHPFTVLHVPGRDLLAEARATAVMDYMARKEIPRVETSNPERIRPFIAQQVAEAEARGYERGKRDALNEAAEGLIPRLPATVDHDTMRVARWLRARAAETPGGAA